MMIEIPVSYGELVDKLTILEIKLEMISEKSKINQVTNEYKYLSSIFDKNMIALSSVEFQLKIKNRKLD